MENTNPVCDNCNKRLPIAEDELDFLLSDIQDLGPQLDYLDADVNHVKTKKKHLHKVEQRINRNDESLVRFEKRTDIVYLDVVAVVSNPVQYNSRYRLYNEFCERMRKEPQVRLFTVELQHRNKPFVTDASLKLRTSDEVWHKENMINVAVNHLPANWEYMAWIDADVEFQRKDWVAETLRQLQHYDIVQLFSHAVDLGPNGETMDIHNGFCYQWVQNLMGEDAPRAQPYKKFHHTGYAFAMKAETYDNLGGLMEFPILGAADHHMCKAWIGRVEESYPNNIHPNYQQLCHDYQERCERHLKQNISYVAGTLVHYWHGKKVDRKYHERWQILIRNDFDPLMDIKKDRNNLWKLEGNKSKLRDDLRSYFRVRNEDSIDV